MNFLEITIRPDGIKIQHEAEERLTGEQKFYVILAVIACISILRFVALVVNAV